MRIKNTENQYGIVAIIFHWLMAFLLISMLILGLYMADLPKGLVKLKLYGLHKSIGILILTLFLIRFGWRLINITPRLDLPWWEKIAARSVHWALYFFMVAMPLSGWMMSSAAGVSVSFFGLVTMPNLVPADKNLFHFLNPLHKYLAFALIAIILLHFSAALKHHFYDKDDILKRMFS